MCMSRRPPRGRISRGGKVIISRGTLALPIALNVSCQKAGALVGQYPPIPQQYQTIPQTPQSAGPEYRGRGRSRDSNVSSRTQPEDSRPLSTAREEQVQRQLKRSLSKSRARSGSRTRPGVSTPVSNAANDPENPWDITRISRGGKVFLWI